MSIVLYYLVNGSYLYELKEIKNKEYDMLLNTLKSNKELVFL